MGKFERPGVRPERSIHWVHLYPMALACREVRKKSGAPVQKLGCQREQTPRVLIAWKHVNGINGTLGLGGSCDAPAPAGDACCSSPQLIELSVGR